MNLDHWKARALRTGDPADAAFVEVHERGVDGALRAVAAKGKRTDAPFKQSRTYWNPGNKYEHTVNLKAGKLHVTATDHSPDGVNPVSAWLQGRLVYVADDYGAVVIVYKTGAWVEQLLAKVVVE